MSLGKIFLIGLPASGKTTSGLKLAKKLGIEALDLDAEIIEQTGREIFEIFENEGEEAFRELEQEQLLSVLGKSGELVISTGGGTPCYFDNLDQMKQNGTVVFINTPITEIEHRLSQTENRPLMKSRSLQDLVEERMPYYRQAHHTVNNYEELVALFA